MKIFNDRFKVHLDGYSERPNMLFDLKYFLDGDDGMLSMCNTIGCMSSGGVHFDANQWYKITVTGSPNAGDDGDKCQQEIVIEGPSVNKWFSSDKYITRIVNDCLVLADVPLKVYATRSLNGYYGNPLDGVIRNVSFKNININTTIDTICS